MKSTIVVAVGMAAALAVAGCASDEGDTDGPIVVGSVNALSGPAVFPEASQAAKAVFDRVNADGGIDGREIEYTILDDKADPAAAAAAAREVVESDQAVALVGSASLLECEVNGPYYEQQDILSVQGTGVDQECFANPNISPVNVGPFGDTQMTLTYGSEVLGLKKICGFLAITGSTEDAYRASIDAWTEETGKELVYLDASVPYGAADYTPYLVRAKEAGCDGIYANAVEPDALAQMKAAAAQGMDDVTFLYLTSVYSNQFAQAATEVAKGVYVPAEFAPYTDATNEANADWQELMKENDIPLTSFGQGGYLAATYFVDVLKSIDGDITRETVNEALREMDPIENPMVGTPWVFGPDDTHNSNRAAYPVVLKPGSGAWENAADDWLRLDG